MKPAQLGVKALANNLAIPDDHGPNQRVGADLPTPALGKLQCPLQVRPIRSCELRVHATD
jgi:hypothetical protein